MLDSATPDQDASFLKWLKGEGIGYWHWLSHCWLLVNNAGHLRASVIRDKAEDIYGRPNLMVLELKGSSESDTWSGLGPKSENHNMFEWIRSNWN